MTDTEKLVDDVLKISLVKLQVKITDFDTIGSISRKTIHEIATEMGYESSDVVIMLREYLQSQKERAERLKNVYVEIDGEYDQLLDKQVVSYVNDEQVKVPEEFRLGRVNVISDLLEKENLMLVELLDDYSKEAVEQKWNISPEKLDFAIQWYFWLLRRLERMVVNDENLEEGHQEEPPVPQPQPPQAQQQPQPPQPQPPI